ncbi:hypothetical protein [Horticoccus sp. 23ND18S-11]|uniref:hypothetical protein n=1 Tax=Horticoccus sp. 23ND18S-11 TaxID=3391832 RepID=UPI0039C95A98
MISPVFAQILRSGREHFNGRFMAARRVQADLNGETFTAFLAEAVDPLVQAVERVEPGRAADVAMVAYDLALDLLAQRIIGHGERGTFIEAGWRRLLPGVARGVAANPERLIGATTNALHLLGSTPGARPAQWLDLMERLSPACADDPEVWLKLGQVAAWRSGLAHFREPALALADALPEGVALELVDAPPGVGWSGVKARLHASPWFDPAQRHDDASALRVAAQAGAFRGFGGFFPEPPRVVAQGDHFFVSSGAEGWMLAADAFGATFHRAKPEERPVAPALTELPGRLRVTGVRLEFDGREVVVPDLGAPSSVAVNATTLAITSLLTHRVVLIALPQR